MTKEKTYILRVTETELRNTRLRNALVAVVGERLRLQKHKDRFVIANVEYEILKKHYSWVAVEMYAPKKKDRFPGEVGKYNGKRVCIKGK